MARNTFEAWIPEEWDSQVVQRVQQVSVIESEAREYPMATDTRHIPRSAGVDVNGVAKGSAYDEDTSTNDEVLLTAKKAGRAIRIADEDLQDSNVAIIEQKRVDWATSWAKYLDNACLAVTAAESGVTVPYTSVYKAIRTTNANTGYTADTNYVATATGGVVTYNNLSSLLGKVEVGDYWEEGLTLVIAHPSLREKLRNIKDDQNEPIFVRGQGGDSGTPDTLFGHRIRWSLGARTSATAVHNPTGNPLMIVVNREFLAIGKRSGPESRVAGPDTGAAFLTDEALLKMRARRAFALTHEKAAAVLEVLA
ncbi:major capsid protein [Streptomyces phage KimJongPhill]|jgi:HK97 family phage major capsid protein|uniref:Major capsid protein n=1 Tax=Streptomyces phage KimJongPhill TaxID=2848886 RepID=A0A8F2IW97_9CAUD|nr:major capsid protein [Streptomyces phage KimJongPhill]QWT29794.1 major capsid protein [Streptomyces phage KimJongPhill]